MIYFTSDLHLGHANIIRHCGRPFENVSEMDDALIDNWNMRVHRDDIIYIVGDLIFRAKNPEYYLERLKGKKHLITGNHDKQWIKHVDIGKHFFSVTSFQEIGDGNHKITLCHYPMMSWNGMNRGSYLIFGHIHNNTNGTYWPLLKTMTNALNAGVDINGFIPVTFEELVENNERFRKES